MDITPLFPTKKRKLPANPLVPATPREWQCPACARIYPSYSEAKCCREIPLPRYGAQLKTIVPR